MQDHSCVSRIHAHLGVVSLAAALAVGVAMGEDPVPVACFKLEQRVSFSNGAEAEGGACYNTCTDCVVKQCAPGMDYESCGTETVHCIGCKKGTWHKNPDGSWACLGATGFHDIDAVTAAPGPQCGSGGDGEM